MQPYFLASRTAQISDLPRLILHIFNQIHQADMNIVVISEQPLFSRFSMAA